MPSKAVKLMIDAYTEGAAWRATMPIGEIEPMVQTMWSCWQTMEAWVPIGGVFSDSSMFAVDRVVCGYAGEEPDGDE